MADALYLVLRVRVNIIVHARIKYVGKSQSCMVSNGRFIPHASYICWRVTHPTLHRACGRAGVRALMRLSRVAALGHAWQKLSAQHEEEAAAQAQQREEAKLRARLSSLRLGALLRFLCSLTHRTH